MLYFCINDCVSVSMRVYDVSVSLSLSASFVSFVDLNPQTKYLSFIYGPQILCMILSLSLPFFNNPNRMYLSHIIHTLLFQ